MKLSVCPIRAIGFMLCTGAVISIQSCKNKTATQEQADKYIVTKPQAANADYEQQYVAEIKSLQNVEIRSKANGFIEKLFVDEGSCVNAGQVLLSLNSREYYDELLKASASLKNTEAELKQAEVEIKNIQLLTDRNIISKSELATAQAKKDAILATMQEAKAGISLANINLSYTSIRAPFSGYINRIPKKTGSLVQEGDVLTTLSNNQSMYAYFNVSETDYLQYTKNPEKYKTVKLMLADGSIFPQTGTIETIDGEINPETGTIAFRAKFHNPDKILKNGASGKVLLTKSLANSILVPIKSTYEVQENLYVFVIDKNGTVTQRKVEPLTRLTNEYAIISGITQDDMILYEGVQLVKDGDKVQTIFRPMNELSNL